MHMATSFVPNYDNNYYCHYTNGVDLFLLSVLATRCIDYLKTLMILWCLILNGFLQTDQSKLLL
jgi:hypothetical protein